MLIPITLLALSLGFQGPASPTASPTGLQSAGTSGGAPAAAREALRSGPWAPPASLPPGPPLPALEESMMLHLRTGQVVFGGIEEHDPDGISFRRLLDGGLVRLPWNFLDGPQENELRAKFGYVDVLSDEVLVPADLIVLVDGTELIGLVTARDGSSVVVKSASGLVTIAAARVATISSIEAVPALELYTKDELYSAELVKTDLATAAGQADLGAFCERIRDFQRAATHYEAALKLSPGSPELQFALDRASAKAVVQVQLDALAEIDHLKRRRRYQDALAAIEAFPERFPETPLRTELFKLRDSVLKARDRALRDLVPSRWFFWSSRLARRASGSETLEQIEAWAAEGMAEEVLAKVTEDARELAPDIEPENVRKYWNERKRGRWRVISYGNETWLLGDDRALREYEPKTDSTEKEPESELEATRKQFEEKLSRFLASQERQRRTRTNEDESAEREDAWRSASLDDRARWTHAYFIEFSGSFDLHPKLLSRNCRSCGGAGVTEVIYTGSARTGDETGAGSELYKCPTCHGIGQVRRIQYR